MSFSRSVNYWLFYITTDNWRNPQYTVVHLTTDVITGALDDTAVLHVAAPPALHVTNLPDHGVVSPLAVTVALHHLAVGVVAVVCLLAAIVAPPGQADPYLHAVGAVAGPPLHAGVLEHLLSLAVEHPSGNLKEGAIFYHVYNRIIFKLTQMEF